MTRPAHTLVAVFAVSACACIVSITTESHVSAIAMLGAGVYAMCWHVAVVEDVRRAEHTRYRADADVRR